MQHTITVTIPETLEPHLKTIDDVETFVSVIMIEALQRRVPKDQDTQLEEAAHLMLNDYTNDEELTSFTALDGDPIYE